MDTLCSLMSTKNNAESVTPYAQWLAGAMRQRDIDLAELGRQVGSDYNYMWRLSAGRRRRPGHDLAVLIGRVLGDVEGSIRAAEYKSASALSSPKKKIYVLGYIAGEPIEVSMPLVVSQEDMKAVRDVVAVTLRHHGFKAEDIEKALGDRLGQPQHQ